MARPMFTVAVLSLVVAAAVSTGASPAGGTLPPGGTFIDDDGNIHEPAIEAVRAAGITRGCSPVGDLFCPSAPTTRAETAAFLIRALDEEANLPPYQGTFSDVPPGRWFTPYVERLAQLGIGTGYGDGTFRPDATLSRAEMAALLVRALEGEPDGSRYLGTFVDVPEGQWFTPYVERLADLGITRGCATNPARYCPVDQVLRDQMASFLARALDLPVEPVPPRPDVGALSLRLQPVGSGFSQPVFVTAPAGDARLFVVEKAGVVRIVAGGTTLPTPFLDIRSSVSSGGERGLLGMAFHPRYAENGRFFVHFTDIAGVSRVVEYSVSGSPDAADPGSARELLFVDQPASNHNGGMIAFGPDGLLYVALGDGGGANDQYRNAQDLGNLLGTITRVDVDAGTRTIFAYGLRNPWRFSFDGPRLYVADVGQSSYEEVGVLSIFDSLPNLGWPIMEGAHCFGGSPCSTAGLVLPVLEYDHGQGCSITGGFVYRGSAIPELAGHYLYGDFCEGFVRSFRYTGSGVAGGREWATLRTSSLASFGVDGFGELYTVSLGGTVSKIVEG